MAMDQMYTDCLRGLEAAKAEALDGPPYTFDRYRDGVKMAEGVRIERETNLQDAICSAARIAASKYPKGDVLVFSGLEVSARLKAEWQAQALEEAAGIAERTGLNAHPGVLRMKAKEKRRQAEEGTS